MANKKLLASKLLFWARQESHWVFLFGGFVMMYFMSDNTIGVFDWYEVLIIIVWMFITYCLFDSRNLQIDDVHGSAKFASDVSVNKLAKNSDGLLIGRSRKDSQLLYYDGPGHLLTIAASRSGKGVGSIIPNLLKANRSILCVDPKGENAKITSRTRANFGKVFTLDPFGVLGTSTDAFNPLDAIDLSSEDYVEDVQSLAEALVFDSSPYAESESHWNEEAKALWW
ncbi:MAG: type IV secretory system conjugative DNA transfer family protein [Bacteroidetes bacterium]|nr:type IV secretory system conjugative DNA transfer family protein [Bacteroidota bacterium]